MYTVYCHTFPHGKVYVGITRQKPEYRWKHGKGYYRCPAMGRAVLKYGWENIDHDIIAEVETLEEAERLERYLIDFFHSTVSDWGYNVLPGGDVTQSVLTEEMRYKIGSARRGKSVSAQTRKKQSVAMTGKLKGSSHPCSKPVYQYTTEGNFVKRWESVREVETAGVARKAGVRDVAQNKPHCKTAGGFVWKYESDVEKVIDKTL